MTIQNPALAAEGVVPLVDLRPPAWPSAVRWAKQLWADPRAVWALAMVPYAVATWASFHSIARGRRTGNLLDFLSAARAMRHGTDIYASGSGGYVYPPLIAFLYQPLSMLGDKAAGFVALGVEAAVAVFTLTLVSRVLVRRLVGGVAGRVDPLLVARVAAFGAICTADKIKGEFSHLETNVWMLVAFTAAMRWVDRRPWLCGLALGFAFNVKYLPVVLVPYLLVRGRWRATGWFAVWAVVLAAVPAASMGWRADAAAWAAATGGLARLFGVDLAVPHAAHVRAITDAVSISLTSGLARATGLPATAALAVAAAIGAMAVGVGVVVYRRAGLPVVRWPAVAAQHGPPFRGLLSVEWVGLLLLTLTFSPFTNSRHLYMLLDVNIAAGALILGSAGRVARWPLVLAALAMAAGISLPPGGTATFDHADAAWRTLGGPGWCMLAMFVTLVWTNARYQAAGVGPGDAGSLGGVTVGTAPVHG